MNLLHNTFFKNVFRVSLGTFSAQIVMLIGMPIITRLYSKDIIGAYALFISTIGITISFVTLGLDNTLVLPKKNTDANALLKATLLLTIGFSILIAVFLQLPFSFFEEYTSIALFIALGTFLQVVIESLGYFKVRYESYKQLSTSKVLRNTILLLAQIGFFYIDKFSGLIFGFIVASVGTILYLIRNDNYIKEGLFQKQTKLIIIANIKRYKEYPKYFCWSNLIFALSSGLPIIIFNEYFSLAQIAVFSIANSIIIQPAGLISSSIRPVLLSKFAKKINNKESINFIYNKVFFILFALGLVLSVGIYFILPNLVTFIFGKDWEESGALTRLLIPFFIWYFISIPSSICSKIYPFQKYTLFYTIASLILKIGSIILAIEAGLDFNHVILVYAFSTFLSDFSNHLIINNKIKKHELLLKKIT